MTAPDNALGELKIGEVISQSFRVLTRRPIQILLICALLTGIPVAATQCALLWTRELHLDVLKTLGATEAVSLASAPLRAFGYVALVAVVTNGLSLGNLETGVAPYLRVLLPAVIAETLAAWVAGIGMFLLIVPGFIALLAFYVAVPIVVIEHRGPIGALRRSAELTRGRRGLLLGLIFVMGIAVSIPALVLNQTTGGILPTGEHRYWIIGARGVLTSVIGAPAAASPIIAYWYLLRARDELPEAQVAQVFA